MRELADTVTIGARDARRASRCPPPGQFAMLWVPGVGEVPISYSAIGPGRRVEHTMRAVGATSAALLRSKPGDLVGCAGPFGRGWPIDDLADRDLLIIAGGLGPRAAPPGDRGSGSGPLAARSVQLLVGARSPDLVLFADQFEHRWPSSAATVSVDRATIVVAGSGRAGRRGLARPRSMTRPRPRRSSAGPRS